MPIFEGEGEERGFTLSATMTIMIVGLLAIILVCWALA